MTVLALITTIILVLMITIHRSDSLSYSLDPLLRLSPRLQSRLWSSSSPTLIFDLSNEFIVDNLIESQDESIRGVYVIESKDNETLFVGSSDDVLSDLREYRNKYNVGLIHSVRIQSFDDENLIEAYKQELIRQTNPKGFPKQTSNSKFEALKNKISSMKESNGDIISPFESKDLGTSNVESKVISINAESNEKLEFNEANVDMVLNEIRPYLIADGGNVSVVSVDPIISTVKLFLQGACGSCPSSTTTMKMGIERILKENFPFIKSVEAVSELPVDDALLTLDMVNKALEPILPSIKAMKGEIKVKKVDESNGSVLIAFSGPPRLKQGLELVLKEVKLVKLVEFEDLV